MFREQHSEECASCGDAILHPPHSPPTPHEFVIPDPDADDPHYESRTYTLCTECERKVVDWIEEMDETETRVDPVAIDRLATGLAAEAEAMAALADRVRALSRDDPRGEEVAEWRDVLADTEEPEADAKARDS